MRSCIRLEARRNLYLMYSFGALTTKKPPQMYRIGLTLFAISDVYVALSDIKGKALDVPVYKLLGGKHREKVKVYASTLFNMEYPTGTARETAGYVEQGFKAVKFGWGLTPQTAFGLDEGRDVEIVRMIREAVAQFLISGRSSDQ